MIAWFADRSLREKRMIAAMLALLVLTLIWFVVIRPLGDGLSAERQRHADAVIRLGETQAAVTAIRAAQRARSAPLTGTFADAVRARPAALVPWLARLEAGGVLVETATLTDKGDRSVGVQLVLKRRGL